MKGSTKTIAKHGHNAFGEEGGGDETITANTHNDDDANYFVLGSLRSLASAGD